MIEAGMKDKLRELAERWKGRSSKFTPEGDLAFAYNRCVDELLAILDAEGDGGAAGGFSMPQSFVDRVTSSDEDEPPVMGAGCVDSIKRIAEEMVSACKAERQGDAEFTPEAMDDWAHRIMCFADYIPAHPARSGVVSDEDVETACRKYYNCGHPVYPPVFEGMRAALESYERNRK